MVEITRYSPERFEYIYALLTSQDRETYVEWGPEHLPEIGFIAFDSATPIAAGFLRRVEGGYAQIDTLVSNKGLRSEIRHEGISGVVLALLQESKELRLKGIYAHTSDQGVLSRAEALGFRYVPQTIIALPLPK